MQLTYRGTTSTQAPATVATTQTAVPPFTPALEGFIGIAFLKIA